VVLAVVTWNVHAGVGNFPQLIDDLTNGRITGSPVRSFVILLQESIAGSQYDVTAFGRQRQLWTSFTPVRESKAGTSGNAMVTTEQPIEIRTMTLPRERRVRKAVTAQFDIAGQSLFIVNAHLENRTGFRKGLIFSDVARGRQAEALLAQLPAGHGILGGDLNTWLGEQEPAWQAFLRRFRDTPDAPLGPTFADRLVLDHLFFDLPDGWYATRQVVASRYGSDHHPVLGLVMDSHAP
jgi:endonuclease/exonuclease/phosphatase family metal-dependent hydrolase